MATNLNEYYQSKGQALPSVSDRTATATEAGIKDYVGSAEQNNSLLGYLQNVPSQGTSNVITGDSLTQEKPIEIKEQKPETDSFGMTGTIGALYKNVKTQVDKDQAEKDKQDSEYATLVKSLGDTSEFENKTYEDQGVDRTKKVRDNYLSLIEQEQESLMRRIESARTKSGGLKSGAENEIARITRESSINQARLGIGLSASTRDYDTASNIANRLISQNTAKIKADIESRQFILGQLGTKLATEKANSFNLQLRALDKEEELIKSAVDRAMASAKDGFIDGGVASDAVQDLISGKISTSEFADRINDPNASQVGVVDGVDISRYATDPLYIQKVTSIWESIGDISDAQSAEDAIKNIEQKTGKDSKITGEMIFNTAKQYGVSPRLMISMLQQESGLGTSTVAINNNNLSGITWTPTYQQAHPEVSKGTARPTAEGGHYVKFPSMQNGVEGLAKWLASNKSKARYTGEFQSTLETVVNGTSEPEISKKRALEELKKNIGNGDYKTAYKQIENTYLKTIPAEQKTQFIARRDAISSIADLEDKLTKYEAEGGKMGLLTGTYEDIYNKLGAVKDDKYKTLAVDLRIALQKYRKDLSGAAFSEQEAQDYESVNPSGKNSLKLNQSILEGMKDNFKRGIENSVDAFAGDGAKYIREYAQAGTNPKTVSQVPFVSTPAGNSFKIIE